MIEFPLYIFLFIFFIFLAIFAAFYAVIVYHIVMSASFTLASFLMSFFIFTAVLLTLYAARYLLAEVDWRQIVFTLDLSFFTGLIS